MNLAKCPKCQADAMVIQNRAEASPMSANAFVRRICEQCGNELKGYHIKSDIAALEKENERWREGIEADADWLAQYQGELTVEDLV